MLRLIVPLLVMTLLAGCAIYDSERGPLVTSSPQTVKAVGYGQDSVVIVEEFQMPGAGSSTTLTETGMVGLVTFPVSHTYIFSETDRDNLRLSVLASLATSGVKVIERGSAPAEAISSGAVHLFIEIESAGMIDSSYGVTVPLIVARIGVDRGEGVVYETRTFQGDEKMTVIGSKEDGIRKFVSEIHRRLGGSV